MTVTQVEPCGKTRYRIYLDGESAFILYKGEMKKLNIREGGSLSSDTLEMIYTEILYRRARLRAMHLLEDMDRTEAGLREKLRQGEYPEEITEKAIAYVRRSDTWMISDMRKILSSAGEIRKAARK